MANLQLPLNQDHEVLGSEYCSGYMDSLGKWNNGFYCPASDESQDVFCCGTDSHKYCCTKKDQVVQAEVEDLTVLIGVVVGASAAILIITLVSCFCCSCCLLYKKRNPNSASLYHLHTTSEHSGVTNMYSMSNAASRSATPLPIGLHQASGVIPPGGGILVGGPNHHASQHHLHTSQLLIDGLVEPHNQYQLIQLNNGGNAISHSHTLPHSMSHHGKGLYRGDPDLISHHAQQVMREYGTMGRMVQRQSEPPPYQDPPVPEAILLPSVNSNNYLMASEKQSMFMGNPDSVLVTSISQGITSGHQQQQQQHQQQHMIFPHRQQQQQQLQQQQQDDQDDKQLFHSTKF